jgi:hypothetical protein
MIYVMVIHQDMIHMDDDDDDDDDDEDDDNGRR